MNYAEIAPSPPLRGIVRCFWTLRAENGAGAERILPDGCAELILNRADPFRGVAADTIQPHAMLVGQLRRCLVVEPTGAVDLLGIRFEPAGLYALLGAPVHEFTEARLDLDAVDRTLRRDLERAAARGLPEVEAALLARARDGGRGGAAVADMLAGRRPEVPRRTLERVFRKEVGLPPKQLAKIARFQSVIRAVERTRKTDWAGLAVACGYYDQAHLIRDFKRFAGLPPGRYFAEEHVLADLLTGRRATEGS